MNAPVRLHIAEPLGLARRDQPLTFGVPFPRGALDEPGSLRLRDEDGNPLPLQAAAPARWPDGSIQWALVDTRVSVAAGGESVLVLEAGAETESGPMPVTRIGADVRVDTGAARITVGPGAGLPAVEGAGTAGELVLTDRAGQERPGRIERAEVTVHGPLRTVVRCTGDFGGAGLRFIVNATLYAGSGAVSLRVTLHNPNPARHPGGLWDLGDPGSVLFSGLAWRCPPPAGGWTGARWRATPEAAVREAPEVRVYQESSGGVNWDSRNHVNREGRVPLTLRGYRVEAGGDTAATGGRAQPTVWGTGPGGTVGAALEDFWQNFPKALAVDGDGLRAELFPTGFPDLHELQGGERKTHTLWLAFGAGDGAPDPTPLAHELRPVLEPAYLAATGAVPWLAPVDPEAEAGWQALVAEAVDPERGFAARREVIDEYGWRNFGDLYADHEAVHYTGPAPVISHYNNQYDAVLGMLLQHLRTADPRWYALARDLARHVYDIDLYHTTADRPTYGGGMFWHTDHYEDAGTATHRTYGRQAAARRASPRDYGGGPANEHTYVSGLLLYHRLTGDPLAAEAVRTQAEWVIAMDDGRRTPLGWVDGGPTGNASHTAEAEFHGPGRGAGHAVNTLLDAFALTGDERYLDAAEGLIRRVAHPADDPFALGLDQPETRWSYVVFLQVLGRYLRLKADLDRRDAAYAYARAVLLNYARWMAEHEVPYLDRPERLEYPTETWAAQEVRKVHVFDVAAQAASGPERERFRERAAFFLDTAVTTLKRWDTRTLTRPLVILLAAAWPHTWFLHHPGATLPAPESGGEDFGAPVPFVSQKARVKARLRSPSGWVLLLLGLLKNGPARLRERLREALR
jgi:hypothetical protein